MILATELMPALAQAAGSFGAHLEEDAVYYGAQGPDFLFFHRAMPWMPGRSLRRTGTAMHNGNPAGLFERMRLYLAANPGDKYALPYALGFLFHYALDRTAHPYVLAMTDQIAEQEHIRYSRKIIHNRIETNIDIYLLREKLGVKDARKFYQTDSLARKPELLRSMGKMMADVINALHSAGAPEAEVVTAFEDFYKVQKMEIDPRGVKRPVIRALEFILTPAGRGLGPALSTLIRTKEPDKKWDYMNKAHSLCGAGNFYSVFERAKADALFLAAGFLKAVQTGSPVGGFIGDASFSTGEAAGK